MAKDGLLARLRASAMLATVALILISASAASGGPPQDRDGITASLEVQKALQLGRELVVKGSYEAAVHVLEERIAKINGSREYLAVLREAYRGRVKELRLANKDSDAEIYNRRLLILDPGSALDVSTQPAATQTLTKSDTPKPN
jgi:hypothetical protein